MAGEFTIKTADQIIADFITYVVANSPQITDMSPGSVIRSFCEGSGVALEELYVATYLGFQRYLQSLPQSIFNFQQLTGTYAGGAVVFSAPQAVAATINIAQGTRIQTASGLIFATTAVGSIAAGQTQSGSIPVQAAQIGAIYNVASGAISVLLDPLPGVTAVTNAAAASGGTDAESPYAFNNRFQQFIEGLGKANQAGLIAGALSVAGVTSCSLVELIPPVGNVNVQVWIDNGQTGGASSALVAQVQSVLDGDGTQNNSGYRAAGVNAVVYAATVVLINVTVNLNLSSGVDVTATKVQVTQAITDYINALPIGATVVWAALYQAIMNVPGVINCQFTTPTGDTTVGSSQVARAGTLTVTNS